MRDREGIDFEPNFRNENLDGFTNLHVLRPPESKKHMFSDWSLCVCVCVCYQHNLKTNNTTSSKFGNLHLYHM